MKKLYFIVIALFIIINANAQKVATNLVFCSDVHFGLTKDSFKGEKNVSAAKVNAAMIEQINTVPYLILPADKGVSEQDTIKNIEAVIITGDIANREETGIQSSTDSWKQFEATYLNTLTLKKKGGQPSKILLTAGNHDVSNAIGFHRPMVPETDPTSYIGIYNLMMQPKEPKTNAGFNYQTDKVHYAADINGVHFQFINLWPDSAERVWMEKDLQTVSSTTPVLLFTHSMPDVEARFFVNPNGDHSINKNDKFENLVTETFKDGSTVDTKAVIEEKAFAGFLLQHPNIKAYFHGHNNYTEYYTWTGPDNNVHLPCFRVDSPMKGKYSSKDETKLSFELISIDPDKKLLTVRECLWNSQPTGKNFPLQWGLTQTIALQ
jgi:3',5'-cyclic AMP phosphodiesterase CpdA